MRIQMTEREDQDCEYSKERFMKEYSVAEERRAPSKSPTCVVRGVLPVHVYTTHVVVGTVDVILL